MKLIEIFIILVIHWIADFVLQTNWQAKNKSKNWVALLRHTEMYAFVWLVTGAIYLYIENMSFTPPREECIKVLYFVAITFFFHTITDYVTSRINARLYARGDIHNFFVSVGFDQVLHYVQLFTTYWYLKYSLLIV